MSSTASEQTSSQMAEAEQCVLGSLMTTPSLMGDVASILNASDFYRGAHQEIYETLRRLSDEGHPTSRSAVHADMANRQVLERNGGPAYLITLTEAAQSSHALYFAQIVREQAIRRRLHAYHSEGLARIFDGSTPELEKLLDGAQNGLDEVADERASSDVVTAEDSLLATIDLMEELSKRDGGVTGVPTGFADLDDRTSGLHPGQMIVIAARPGIGKSTLGLDIARSAAIHNGRSTAIFTLEMSHEEITMRLISAEARVPLNKVRSGKLDDNDWARISRKMPAITEAPLFIDDSPNLTMNEIKTKARRIKQRFGLDLIVIDYLQLMVGDGRSESRQQEVSAMSRACKLLAKELGLPVIVMSQLNRGSTQRADKRPQTSDLRESGAIEQDADMIILLHREEETDPDSPRVGEADFIIGKQRNGPTGVITVAFQGHYSRFVDMQRD